MITKEQAIAATYRQNFYHETEKDSRGQPVVCRVNGKCRVTKSGFVLPVKYGLRHCFYITEENAASWTKVKS